MRMTKWVCALNNVFLPEISKGCYGNHYVGRHRERENPGWKWVMFFQVKDGELLLQGSAPTGQRLHLVPK